MVERLLILSVVATTAWAQAPLPAPELALDAPPAAAQQLAPGDLISIQVTQAPELATSARLDADGAILMPEAGRIELSGLTAAQAGQQLATRLQAHYLLHPQVQVLIEQFAPEPVTVLGAVRNPGQYSARSYADLASLLAAAGGVNPPGGATIRIARPGQPPKVALLGSRLRGGDVITVAAEAAVYVGGDVARPGAYAVPTGGLTLLQALSLAGGITRDGRAAHMRIVHEGDGTAPVQWLDARPIMAGRAADIALQPDDLVYVPHSVARTTLFRGVETAVAAAVTITTGLIVFH